jgi:hypothetical protein
MSGNPTEQPMNVMRWRPIVLFLPFALLIDGAIFYAGWLIWKTAVH